MKLRIRLVLLIIPLDIGGAGWVTGAYTGLLNPGAATATPQGQPQPPTPEELIEMVETQEQNTAPDKLAPQEQAP
jgi:acyl-coenzyme A synthetase/AMP-(fatty) acid ligase